MVFLHHNQGRNSTEAMRAMSRHAFSLAFCSSETDMSCGHMALMMHRPHCPSWFFVVSDDFCCDSEFGQQQVLGSISAPGMHRWKTIYDNSLTQMFPLDSTRPAELIAATPDNACVHLSFLCVAGCGNKCPLPGGQYIIYLC